MTKMAFGKLHPAYFGASIGIISGLATFFMGLVALAFYTGKPFVGMVGTMYVTYNPSLINCALGGALVLINAFIGGYITAWIYNLLLEHF